VRHPSFNEVYDGILYSVAASLGFATLENIMYVVMGGGYGVALLRALLSVPGHALWGVIMGYYVGRARFAPAQQRGGLVLHGVGLAVFWHGLYDFLAFGADYKGNPLAGLFALGVPVVVIVNWVVGVQLIRRAQVESVFKRPPPLINPVGALALGWRYCHQCGKPGPRGSAFCTSCGYHYPQ
jgi:RsiW-degrading membrane proteinase PrsW (M82 family)